MENSPTVGANFILPSSVSYSLCLGDCVEDGDGLGDARRQALWGVSSLIWLVAARFCYSTVWVYIIGLVFWEVSTAFVSGSIDAE